MRAILLTLLLVATGFSAAFARGQAPADGQMVLCTGNGAVMVYVDGDGQPTSPPQLCADALHLLSATGDAALLPGWEAVLAIDLAAPSETHLVSLLRPLRSVARAPPLA